MNEEVYRRLATTLDAIPNGFPATESGVELRMLAKIFEPEEAHLASVMRLYWEPATDIAARAGVEAKAAARMLKTMVRKGQILFRRKDRQLMYRLMPFAVGIYEEQIHRMDKEFAELVEEYFAEAKGFATGHTPPLHRVIPVEEAVPAGVEIYPYEKATQLLNGAKSWGVRDCICRLQKRLVGEGCEHPVENCLVFAPVEDAFSHSRSTRPIEREEALRLLREAEESGLVHSPGNYQDGNWYICNCCTCCCGVLRSVADFPIPTVIATSSFLVVVDEDDCIACGDCLERCQFGALSVDDICRVDPALCVGCGLCVIVCPTEALSMERRPEEEAPAPPADFRDWSAQRAEARGLTKTP